MTILAWACALLAIAAAILLTGIGIGASIRFGNPTPETPLPERGAGEVVPMRGRALDEVV